MEIAAPLKSRRYKVHLSTYHAIVVLLVLSTTASRLGPEPESRHFNNTIVIEWLKTFIVIIAVQGETPILIVKSDLLLLEH